jgi:hypothetical protein
LDELFAIRPLNHDECQAKGEDTELAWTGEGVRLAA